jgi:hypothetical protein
MHAGEALSEGILMSINRFFGFIIGLVIVLGLTVFEQWLFETWWNTSHLQWYIQNGALIGLVTSVVSMTWEDIDKNTGLISSHPLIYLSACLHLAGVPIYVMGIQVQRNKDNLAPRSLFDLMVSTILLLLLMAIIFVWLLIVVPLQYFIYLICGAPARLFAQSTRKAIACLRDGQLEVTEVGKHEKAPDDCWDANLADKPVLITNIFTSLLFFIVEPFSKLIGQYIN